MPRVWIGIDGNEANVAQRVGSNVYAFELLSSLEKRVRRESSSLAVKIFLSSPLTSDWPKQTEFWQYVVTGDAPLWTVTKLPRVLQQHRDLALFFSPGHYTPGWSPVPVVCSIMDLGYEHFPDQFKLKDLWQLKLLTRWSVRQSRHVVAISQATKRDIMKTYKVAEEKISVIYPGAPQIKQLTQKEAADRRAAMNLPEKYLLYVGTLQPRKNLERLIAAFELLTQKHTDLDLVLVGRPGWLSEPIMSAITNSPQKQRIHHLGFVDQTDKQAILQGAKVLALVGLYEGFGIPPLEAIQAGVIPVVAKAASLPEVVGAEGETVDPYSVEDIATGIQRVLDWPADRRRSELQELRKHAAQFSWDQSASRLEELLLNQARAGSK